MRIIKNIIFSLTGLAAVFTVILAISLSSYNDQDYQVLLVKTVDNFTEHTLAIKGEFELNGFLNPVLSASAIELHSKTDQSFIHIDQFRIQIRLGSLLKGALLIDELLVENVRAEIQTDTSSAKAVNLHSYLPIPIITHAVLKNINLRVDDEQIYILDNLLISAENKQALLNVQGTGKAMGHVFNIEGQLGSTDTIFIQSEPYLVNLIVNWEQVQLSINGTIADLPAGKGLDLIGKLQMPDIATVLTSMPLTGHFSGQGHLTGDFSRLVLSEVKAALVNQQLINLQVTGSIGDLWAQEQVKLHLLGFIQDTALLKQLLPENSLSLNRLNLDADIVTGRNGSRLENLDVVLQDGQGFKLILTGNTGIVDDSQPFRKADIQVKISSKDTVTVNPYLGDVLPEMGPVKGSAHITTQGKNFMLGHIMLLAGAKQKTQLQAKGQVGPLSMDPNSNSNKIMLDLDLHAQQSSELASLFGIKHPEIGPLTVTARLEGSGEQYKLADIKLNTHLSDVLSIQAEGWAAWEKLASGDFQQVIDVTVQAESAAIQDALLIYGKSMPEIGFAKARVRIHGKGSSLSGDDLSIQVGTENSLLLTVQGKVAELSLTDSAHEGIELAGKLIAKNTSYLSKLLESSEIPNVGSLFGEFLLKGNSHSLQIPYFKLSAGRENQLMLNASGVISEIPLRQKTQAQAVDIDLTATMPSSADLSLLLGSEVPDLGELSIKGKLTDHDGIFAIQNLLITLSNPNQADINISGHIKHLLSANKQHMEILFNEDALIRLFDLQPNPNLEPLQGSAFFSNADGDFSIKDLKLQLGNSEIFAVKVYDINTETKENEVYVNTDIFIKQPILLGKYFDIDFPWVNPVSFSGSLQGNKKTVVIKGNSFVGKTKVSSNLIVSLANKKPKISGEISSPNLFLKDFGITPALWQTKSANSATKPTELFSHSPLSLQALHKIDLDLQLSIFKITGVNYKIDRFTLDLLLEDGKLTADPSAFVFTEGHITMNAKVDVTKKPEWALSMQANKIQLSKLLEHQNKKSPIEGNFNFFVDLKSSGISLYDIAASLNGEAGFTLEKGGISRSQLELVFLNPLGWLFSLGVDDEFKISCGLTRYQIKQGVIKSKIFLVDGPKLLIKGKTEVNLTTDSINSLYNVEKKNVFDNSIFPSFRATNVPIRVSGSFRNPIVKQAKMTSVESIADRYLFSPVTVIPQEVIGTLWGFFDRDKVEVSPCKALLKKNSEPGG
ncbi:MAG: hypothetical protein methR_P0888 [Methyloprofundus sp.]|nr:MAG: hypothetical protein methR_P0888 [Methyloprofundus sp.]